MRVFELFTAVAVDAILVSAASVESHYGSESHLETRQQAAVIAASDFLRRGLHACTSIPSLNMFFL